MIRKSFNDHWMCKKNPPHRYMEDNSPYAPFPVTLPHDAMISELRSKDNPSNRAGAYYPGYNYLYTKTFFVPEEDEGKAYFLDFEGVMRSCTVMINRQFAGSHKYGYTGFYIDISNLVKFGQDNDIEVHVYNGSQGADRWYSGSGIYRPVSLFVGDKTHMAMNGLKVSTPEVSEEISQIHVELQLKHRSTLTEIVTIHTDILDVSGNVVATNMETATLMGQDCVVKHQNIYLKNAKLWSLEAPNLYTCRVQVMENDCVLDETLETFGIRKVQMDPAHGLRLNGKPVKLRGSCIHHDNGVIGAATFARAEERRVEISKAAGFNSLRIAHNPASRAMLDACDRLGMLVMEETYDSWVTAKVPYPYTTDFADHWEEDFEAVVAKDFNHPSVFMYCIGNEIKEVSDEIGATWNRKLANKFRTLDPTRFVTNAINPLIGAMPRIGEILAQMDAGKPKEDGDINDAMTSLCGRMNDIAGIPSIRQSIQQSCGDLDLVGYNYARGTYEPDVQEFPNRLLFGAETFPPDIDLNWALVKKYPQILGDYTWTGWDYIGESGIGVEKHGDVVGFHAPWPVYLAYCGDINLIGDRRPMSYYREIVFGLRKEPYIAVQHPEFYAVRKNLTPWITECCRSSWTWSGYEGKPCVVEVYSDAEQVELFCNDKSLGKQAAGEANRFKAKFDTVYEPGVLRAVAYSSGQIVSEYVLHTAGRTAQMSVEADRSVLSCDGQDLAYVMISLRDENGRLNDDVERCVSITVEGPGVLQGLGTGDPMTEESFAKSTHQTFEGRLLAVIRAVGKGTIQVKCETDDLKPVLVEIVAE